MLDSDRHRLSELDTLPLDPLRQAHRMEVVLREYGNSKRCASSVGWGVITAERFPFELSAVLARERYRFEGRERPVVEHDHLGTGECSEPGGEATLAVQDTHSSPVSSSSGEYPASELSIFAIN